MLGEKLILVGGRWHVARLIDYGHIGMGWGDPEDTSLICVAGDEERVAELPLPSGAEPVADRIREAVALFSEDEIFADCIEAVEHALSDEPLMAEKAISAINAMRAAPASPQSSSQVTEERVRAARNAILVSRYFEEGDSPDGWLAQTIADYPELVAQANEDAHSALTAALSPVKGDGQ